MMRKQPPVKSVTRLVADRGAVLFVGICVGVVLGVSFLTDGKPGQMLSGDPEPLPAALATKEPATTPDCADTFPIAPRVIKALRSNEELRIGVFGDSFGDGIWAGALQEMRGLDQIRIFRFSKESTGFTRYSTSDLHEDAKHKLAEQPADIALISFGANDTQGVWADGKAQAYMSTGWQKIIGERVTTFVQLLQREGMAVGWVGLPRMRNARFDIDIQRMNNFYKGLTCKLGIPFVNPVDITQGPDGAFSKELKDPVTSEKYIGRADDGIHMSLHGYQVIARPLLARVAALVRPAKSDKIGGH